MAPGTADTAEFAASGDQQKATARVEVEEVHAMSTDSNVFAVGTAPSPRRSGPTGGGACAPDPCRPRRVAPMRARPGRRGGRWRLRGGSAEGTQRPRWPAPWPVRQTCARPLHGRTPSRRQCLIEGPLTPLARGTSVCTPFGAWIPPSAAIAGLNHWTAIVRGFDFHRLF